MAGLTIETVAAVAPGRVGRIGADQRGGLYDQIPALANSAAERIVGQCIRVRDIPRGLGGGAPGQECHDHPSLYDPFPHKSATLRLGVGTSKPDMRSIPDLTAGRSRSQTTAHLTDQRGPRPTSRQLAWIAARRGAHLGRGLATSFTRSLV